MGREGSAGKHPEQSSLVLFMQLRLIDWDEYIENQDVKGTI